MTRHRYTRFALVLSALLVLPTASVAQTRRAAVTPARPALGFASAIVMTEDEIVVGQPAESTLLPMPASAPGGVHVFRNSGDGWTETAAFTPEDVMIGDAFGAALAMEGGRLFVGAPKQAEGMGAVYLFERSDAGEWSQTGRVTASDGAAGDGFGSAIALYGDLAIIGAPGQGGRGALYVLNREAASGAWVEVEMVQPDDLAEGDRFGAALALADGRALVGAPGPAVGGGFLGQQEQPRAGSLYIFGRDRTGEWGPEARLAAPEGAIRFGSVLLLDRDEALIGAPVTGRGLGAVYAFRRAADTGDWNPEGTLNPEGGSPPAMFGSAMARAGDDLLIGAPFASQLAGGVFVFRRGDPSGEWSQVQQLSVEAPGMGAMLGMAAAATTDLAVLGAPGADFFEGTGFLFTRDASGAWSESATIMDAAGGLQPIVGGQLDCEDGSVVGFTCEEVDLVSFLPVRALGGKRGIMVSDVWGWTDPQTGSEYALVGRFDGTSFVDLSDPENPVYLGDLPLHEGAIPNLWRDIKVYADHAFIVSDGAGPHGVQVFDLTQLRDVRDAPVTFVESAHYDGIHSAHNIVINEATGFAYTVGNSMGGETCGGGLHMIDIRDPTNPTFAGCFADTATGNAGTGYTHDAMCVIYDGPDVDHRGREICFNASETAIGIADVTDKGNPTAIASASYPNVGYAHQGWISEDHRYFYLDDELDELAGTTARTRTLVWDVQDLDDPVLVNEYLGETESSDHNLYVHGDFLYESNYVSGLRILDISDPENPEEVAYFDTVPWGEDAPGFAGAWSNFPYFESGMILVTSMREGLFILKKREPRVVS